MMEKIAIVGIGARLPGCDDLEHFWQLVKTGKSVIGDVPEGRWSLSPKKALKAGEISPDKVYSKKGAFLLDSVLNEDLPFHYKNLDPSERIALLAAIDAVNDLRSGNLNPKRSGVILANIALPTKTSSEISDWIYGRKIERELLANADLYEKESRKKPSLGDFDVLAGPAKLISKHFGFGSSGYVLDAACASSIFAFDLAVRKLLSGELDAVISGGVSVPDPLYTQMGFSQLGALSKSGNSAPLDENADGIVVGEGAGIFVLKRLKDAINEGDQIYGLISGIGLSNDVDGKLLAPSSEGQLRAMKQAYKKAGVSPKDVSLIECHATGTPVGDAVELESLKILLGEGRSEKTVIGSVKSNVGHLLTAANSVSLLKIIFSLRDKVLAPSANFSRFSEAFEPKELPFKVLSKSEPWELKSTKKRIAALSGFGFGGTNGHMVVEEWNPEDYKPNAEKDLESKELLEIRVIGSDSWIGKLDETKKVSEAFFSAGETYSKKDFEVEDFSVSFNEFKIPPIEIKESLPEQILLLKLASRLLSKHSLSPEKRLRTGVFIGSDYSFGSNDYDLRWRFIEKSESYASKLGLKDKESFQSDVLAKLPPALNANRVIGSLGNIFASRISREFGLGGASALFCSGESSGFTALGAAIESLKSYDIDYALVGSVYLGSEIRNNLARQKQFELNELRNENCTMFLLKRVDFKEEAKGSVAIIEKSYNHQSEGLCFGPLSDQGLNTSGARKVFGNGYLGDDLLNLALALNCFESKLYPRSLVKNPNPYLNRKKQLEHLEKPWLKNKLEQRRLTLKSYAAGFDQSFVLTEAGEDSTSGYRKRPSRGLFLIAADDLNSILSKLDQLSDFLDKRLGTDIDSLASDFFRTNGTDFSSRFGLSLSISDKSEILNLKKLLKANLKSESGLGALLPPAFSFYDRKSFDHSKLAFVFPGSGNQIRNMARELGLLFPEILASLESKTDFLKEQFNPSLIWKETEEEIEEDVAGLIQSQVSVSGFFSDLIRAFGIEPEALIPYSLGETSALFAFGYWNNRDLMMEKMHASDLFKGVLSEPFDAARRKWNFSDDQPLDYLAGMVDLSQSEAEKLIKDYDKVRLLIVNSPDECVLGGESSQLRQLLSQSKASFYPLKGLSTVHSDLVDDYSKEYYDLHFQETRSQSNYSFYSCAEGQIYEPDSHSSADSIRKNAVAGFDFPDLIRQAYSDGINTFIEVGPGRSATRMIDKILKEKEFRSAALIPGNQDEKNSLLEFLGKLFSWGLKFDLAKLYPEQQLDSLEKAPKSFKLKRQEALLNFDLKPESLPKKPDAPDQKPRKLFLDREQCLEYARGKIGPVLGEEFAAIDAFPTRVRLPDEPLMLVDRMISIDAEPLSMSSGHLVTEHDVKDGCWYLDGNNIPTAIAVESGQADLFLSAYLGVDFKTKGLAVYRLLDAVVTFHDVLPGPGSTIRYEIDLVKFRKHADVWLFHFQFDGYVGDRKLLTMREGCAGFFTDEMLNSGQGVVLSKNKLKKFPGKLPDGPVAFCDIKEKPIAEEQLDLLREGNLAAVFGDHFSGLSLKKPLTIPGDMLRLVHRVSSIEKTGGRYEMGKIVAEADIHPDDWFITCHFVDDQVMPGTLMYECCLHTLRIYLLGIGWVGETGSVNFVPVPGVKSRLRCRGQVLASTKKVTYRIEIKEQGFNPAPYVIADAYMYSDDKLIVEMDDMSVQLNGTSKKELEELWQNKESQLSYSAASRTPAFSHDQILEFCSGKPSLCFGSEYQPFDSDKRMARLPQPPFLMVDEIAEIKGEAFKMKKGTKNISHFKVEKDAWYFKAVNSNEMPYAFLVENGLQTCGFASAWMGSALCSEKELFYRNLGGELEFFRAVLNQDDVIESKSEVTGVSQSGDMIIQHFDFEMASHKLGPVAKGKTYFGFFTGASLAEQKGIAGPDLDSLYPAGKTELLPLGAPFPNSEMRMVDRVDNISFDGGSKGLGFIRGSIDVDPEAWFFGAHFFKDPVWPGTLGLESFLQLLGYFSLKKFEKRDTKATFPGFPLNHKHQWIYRGQILPHNKEVKVYVDIEEILAEKNMIVASGYLAVDGLIIYQLKNFATRI